MLLVTHVEQGDWNGFRMNAKELRCVDLRPVYGATLLAVVLVVLYYCVVNTPASIRIQVLLPPSCCASGLATQCDGVADAPAVAQLGNRHD